MSERIQDQRPVYMGTFSKYTKAFESRIAFVENDVESNKKALNRYYYKLNRFQKFIYITTIINGISLLAILMIKTFS